MPAVFLHGVPDTCHVWDETLRYLERKDCVILSLPGFACPVPSGFGETKEEYVTWLIGQLESIGTPVDLVGHDSGFMFSLRVASLRPDLIRSWAGGGGPINRDWEWHALAKNGRRRVQERTGWQRWS